MKITKSYSESPSQSTYRNGPIKVFMSLALYCYVMRSAQHKDRALTEIFILQTGNASCSPRLANSQELNLFAGIHS